MVVWDWTLADEEKPRTELELRLSSTVTALRNHPTDPRYFLATCEREIVCVTWDFKTKLEARMGNVPVDKSWTFTQSIFLSVGYFVQNTCY